MKQAHYANLSLTRVLAFLLIFTFHVFFFGTRLNSRAYFPFSAAVQSFLFLSAFLYSQKDVSGKGWLGKELWKIVFPTLLFIGLLALADLLAMLFLRDAFEPEVILTVIGTRFSSTFYALQIGNLWYIPCLLICYVALPFLQKLRERRFFLLILIALCVAEALLALFLNEPIVALPFLAGYYLGSKEFEQDVNPSLPVRWRFYAIPALLSALTCYAYCALAHILPAYEGMTYTLLNGLVTILQGPIGVLLALTSIRVFRFLNAKDEPAYLSSASRFTFWGYLVHESFLVGVFNLLKATDYLAWNIFLAGVATLFAGMMGMYFEKALRGLFEKSKTPTTI